MKILIFNFEYPPLGGGGGVATKYIAEELARKHEVHIITSRPNKRHSAQGLEGQAKSHLINGVHVHRVPVWGRTSLAVASLWSMITFVPSAWWRGKKLASAVKFDVINAQFVIPSGIPAALIARGCQLPMTLSFIGGDIYDPTKGVSPHRHWWLRKMVKIISNQATMCTAISHDTKRRAVHIHKVTKPIKVINLGISESENNGRKTRKELGLPIEAKLIVSLGRLIPRKGYACLLAAMTKTKDAHLIIMGEGPLLGTLKQEAYKMGVSERVHWLGFVSEDDKINILKNADVFISASEHEGFGIVFLEAMEAGLPIIATWEGGQTDFLVQDKNAILVPPKNSQALAQAINRMLGNEAWAKQMGKSNQQAVKNFYWPQVGKRYEEIFRDSISNFGEHVKLRV